MQEAEAKTKLFGLFNLREALACTTITVLIGGIGIFVAGAEPGELKIPPTETPEITAPELAAQAATSPHVPTNLQGTLIEAENVLIDVSARKRVVYSSSSALAEDPLFRKVFGVENPTEPGGEIRHESVAVSLNGVILAPASADSRLDRWVSYAGGPEHPALTKSAGEADGICLLVPMGKQAKEPSRVGLTQTRVGDLVMSISGPRGTRKVGFAMIANVEPTVTVPFAKEGAALFAPGGAFVGFAGKNGSVIVPAQMVAAARKIVRKVLDSESVASRSR